MTHTLAQYIDHTLLAPEATEVDILRLCEEAKTYGFYSVCINPYWVPVAVSALKDTPVQVCTVIGFPLGATSTATKIFETQEAVALGATEVDMVVNIGLVKSGDVEAVRRDIEGVVLAAHPKARVKVILETGMLTDEEIILAATAAKEAGADFVKTSTGFLGTGASEAAVRLMREVVGEALGVKASGGIKNKQIAEQMIEAGANRLGASSGIQIVLGEESNSAY